MIGGPCLAESLDLCLRVAEKMSSICTALNLSYVFKASFDKANRSSGESTRGAGIDATLKIFERVRDEFGIPVTTDIHLPEQAAVVAEGVQMLQIPAFLCRQTDLLVAAAQTGLPINVKKGQFLAPHDTKNIVEKLDRVPHKGTMLTERGSSFGYNALVVDMPGLEVMRSFGVPVCFDATHSAQRPGGGGTVTSGNRESIPAMLRAACAVGIDALFLEVHPDPTNAQSDAATQWPLAQAEWLIRQAAELYEWRKNLVELE